MIILQTLESFFERNLGGFLTFGPLTMFGYNAMHGQINLRTKKLGFICINPPISMFRVQWPFGVYLSPDGTPQASTFLIGRNYTRAEKVAAIIRWGLWGHGYDPSVFNPLSVRDFVDGIGSIKATIAHQDGQEEGNG